VNPQVVRTAEMLDVSCIVFSRGKLPSDEVIELAKECGITIMTTRHTMYTTCGILYSYGIPGSSPKSGK
jgi:Serine kinase of the HPr protein, regulates carbohydrate metabolism